MATMATGGWHPCLSSLGGLLMWQHKPWSLGGLLPCVKGSSPAWSFVQDYEWDPRPSQCLVRQDPARVRRVVLLDLRLAV